MFNSYTLLLSAFVVVVIALYFLPTILAICTGHPKRLLIFGLNIPLGVTLLGLEMLCIYACLPDFHRGKQDVEVTTVCQ